MNSQNDSVAMTRLMRMKARYEQEVAYLKNCQQTSMNDELDWSICRKRSALIDELTDSVKMIDEEIARRKL